VRSVDVALYADLLAAEASSLEARGERLRSALRLAAIETRAREGLDPETVARLERMGLQRDVDERSLRAQLREVERALEALGKLQVWVETRMDPASAA
jgi:hypothetical protein